MYFDQREYDIRFEWGLRGVEALAPISDVVVIVDVLSFTTCVDVAVGRGGSVYPYRGALEDVAAFAAERGALVANHRSHPVKTKYSLAPTSLVTIPSGTKLVLPSPNGSRLSLATGATPTLAGCLRNAQAVARAAQRLGQTITVIAAGERWPDRSLRPSLEDCVGSGAILSYLSGQRSPEAEMAIAAFEHARPTLRDTIMRCGSGKELVGRGFSADVELAIQLNVSSAAPQLVDGAYITSYL